MFNTIKLIIGSHLCDIELESTLSNKAPHRAFLNDEHGCDVNTFLCIRKFMGCIERTVYDCFER